MEEINFLAKAVGERVKISRVRARMNQAALAARVGMSRASISNFENGLQPITLEILWQISQAVQVSLHDLIPSSAELPKPVAPKPSPSDARWIGQFMKQVNGVARGNS